MPACGLRVARAVIEESVKFQLLSEEVVNHTPVYLTFNRSWSTGTHTHRLPCQISVFCSALILAGYLKIAYLF